MSGFKLICENNSWQFAIMPSNNKQPMGYSVDYKSRAECEQAVGFFKNFVKEKLITSVDSPYVRIDSVNGKFVYKFFDEAGNLIFASRCIEKKASCKDSINSILNRYIHEDIIKDC